MSAKVASYEEKMKKSITALESELDTVRVGRANPKVFDKVTVDYYGVDTPLAQVGNMTIPEAKILQIQPWEASMLKPIEKAIIAAELGLTPTNDGKIIRVIFPDLTEERRKQITKDVKKKGEDAKVSIRNIRRDGMDALKKIQKKSEISEDELKDLEDELQKITDKYVAQADKLIEAKNKDVLSL
ncbi:MAG: ribosome recycling factor [Clostridiales bacterium]|nr:ribosome recycling factor [Clostridiales bacterium]